jgi:hypothetical protein
MKGVHNTYCSHSFLDEIIKGRKKDTSYSIAFTMLNKISNIIVDMPNDDLKKLIEKDEIYNRLNKRENKSLKAREWLKDFSPVDICDDIFLINEGDIKEYKKIKQEYGCLIIADNPNDIKAFERYSKGHPFNLVPNSDKIDDPTIKSHDSWTQFFDEFNMSPLNSILITDNFMFGSKFDNQKEYSLFAILKSIAPKDLKEDFHITIFLNNAPDRNGVVPLKKEKAENLIEEIKNLNLCKSVKVTIVAHTIKSTTHDRELITNYHYMHSGAGFGVVDENGVKEVAKGQVQHVFCNMDSTVTIKQIQAEVAMWLKPIFEGTKGGDSTYSYIVGDKVNRLFL